jgi:predicted dehydrogenase
MSARPKLAFLGLGWIGRQRMQALLESGCADAIAIADADETACRAAAELAPGTRVCASLPELLELGADGVVIATPSAQHAEQALASLEAGCAVFCQKPLGRSAAECSAVLAAARSADRLLHVDFSYRYTAALCALRGALESGQLGEVYALNLTFHNAYGPDKPWFYERAQSGGGCVMDLGVHLVDAALWLLDFPELRGVTSQLFHRGKRLAPGAKEVEDFALASVELDGGPVLHVACSWNLPQGCDAVIKADLFGTRATGSLQNVGGSFYDFKADLLEKSATRPLARPPDAWGGRALVSFARQLSLDPRFDPGADRLLHVAEVIDAIYGVPRPGGARAHAARDFRATLEAEAP